MSCAGREQEGRVADLNASPNRYAQIIERIFSARYEPGVRAVDFTREDLVSVAKELNIALPKNLSDVV